MLQVTPECGLCASNDSAFYVRGDDLLSADVVFSLGITTISNLPNIEASNERSGPPRGYMNPITASFGPRKLCLLTVREVSKKGVLCEAVGASFP